MRKLFIVLTAIPACAFSQSKSSIGLIAGANFANVTKASSINSSNKTGFMVGAFIAPGSKGIMSMRTELIFSRQGYDYQTNTNTGSVSLNYLTMPTLTGIRIGKFALIQAGVQTSLLLNAKADSSNQTGNGQYGGMMSMMNRFNYGAAAGLEIYPFKGIIIGARYNISMNPTYKDFEANSNTPPSFMPDINAKNNVVQLFAGYKF